jgi:predicted ATP-grasp superfamily ATP-dependent carboligase
LIATEAVLPDTIAPRVAAPASDASWPKTVATVVALELLIPVSLAVVAGSVMLGAAKQLLRPRRSRALASPRKTVLISGGKMTKALQLARSFHAAGHRVVLIESEAYWLTAHRFSRAVDRFYTVPRPESPGYADALLRIVEREAVDVYVPVCSPVASLYDSLAVPQLSRHCEVIHVDPESIRDLDDKYAFAQVATSLGLRVPKSILVTDPRDVLDFDFASERRPFILKSIAYDSIRRLDLTRLPRPTFAETEAFVRSLPISPENPWVMQEFIAGTEYCTHGTLRAGELRVHCCCKSSASQLNYENEDKPEIERWVRRFGRALGLTGQASIDFIEAADDGQIYAIECNPRTHSAITMYYDHPDLAAAYLGGTLANAPLAPLPSSRPTYWLYHELWRLVASLGLWRRTVERLRVIARGKDAVLDWRDPLPFLMLYHWHVPMLLLRDLRERRGWLRIDFNIGKLVQLGGD